MARRVAAARGLTHVELDAVFHQRGWTPLSDEAFEAAIAVVASEESWVVCGNYRRVADLLMARADTVVLFDLPRWIVMSRVVRRTLRRIVRREELWNGNRERWRNLCSLDPEESVIVWAWTTHAERHQRTVEFLARPSREDLRLVHVATLADERRVYAGLRAEVRVPRAGRQGAAHGSPGVTVAPDQKEGPWTSG